MPKFPGGGGSGGSGVGDVTGPAISTDNAIATFDGTTGKIIQDSGALVEDAPSGGSILGLVEYAVAPVAPSAGSLWIQAKDASTKTLNYYDGSNTFSVDLSL